MSSFDSHDTFGVPAPTPSSSNTLFEQFATNMAQRVEDLEASLRAAQEQASQPVDNTTSMPRPNEPKGKLPEEFRGNRGHLNSFLLQLTIYFNLRASQFPSDYNKIIFASSFFRDKALNWLRPQLNFYLDRLANPTSSMTPMFTTFAEFEQQLRNTFGDINEEATAERELRSLRQTQSVGFYTSEFQRIASILQWNNKALVFAYYNGLKEVIKDEVSRVGRPTDLNDLVHLATQIDGRLFERLREQQFDRQRFVLRPAPRPFFPGKNTNSFATPEPMDLSASMQPPNFDNSSASRQICGTFQSKEVNAAMHARNNQSKRNQTKRRKLTAAEHQHRRDNNLCLYCGKGGHIVSTCPELAARSSLTNHSSLAASTTTPKQVTFDAASSEDNFEDSEN